MVLLEDFEEKEGFVFDEKKAEGVKVGDWARWVCWNLLRREKGKKNPKDLSKMILNEGRKPLFTESGWKKQLAFIKKPSYQSPFPNEEKQSQGRFPERKKKKKI